MSDPGNYFIWSESVKLVKGAARSLVIDYGRGEVYFLPNDYFALVHLLNRKKLAEAEQWIDAASKPEFDRFIQSMLDLELAFLTTDPDSFPVMEAAVPEPFRVQDAIIELDITNFSSERFGKICAELDALCCLDIQLRLLSDFNHTLLNECLEVIQHTGINYAEVHCASYKNPDYAPLLDLLGRYAVLNHIFIYGQHEARIHTHTIEAPGRYPVTLGDIYLLNYDYNEGQCCGIINYDNLSFTRITDYYKLTTRNGCLDKKISIDSRGNIKNCPSMPATYGNVDSVSLASVMADRQFLQYGGIHKDQITVCRDCEFRYNCTDCRAFISDPGDLYSKPLKCDYNPYTATWGNKEMQLVRNEQDINVT